MKTNFTGLNELRSPGIYLSVVEPEAKKWIHQYFYSWGDNVKVIRLRGRKMKSTADLMTEFGAAFQFFDGFGENWHALEDVLGCLDEWMAASGYLTVIEESHLVLAEEELHQLSALIVTLNAVSESWREPILDNGRFSREGIRFATLFLTSSDNIVGVSKRFNDAQALVGVDLVKFIVANPKPERGSKRSVPE